MTAQDRLIQKWISELQDAGLTYDEILKVFELAKVKLESLKK